MLLLDEATSALDAESESQAARCPMNVPLLFLDLVVHWFTMFFRNHAVDEMHVQKERTMGCFDQFHVILYNAIV